VPVEGRPQLGRRWECFKCGAKFYDLNKPEPLCPKCGANQHERPKVDAKARISAEGAPAPRPPRVIPPLLDDEEDAVVTDEELDLGIAVDDEAFIEGDEDEEFGEEEEEEEP
jgi:predicted  nucleic acid-binding Zn-ribbon protein